MGESALEYREWTALFMHGRGAGDFDDEEELTPEIVWGVFSAEDAVGERKLLFSVSGKLEVIDVQRVATLAAAAPELLEVAQRWWAILDATDAGCICGAARDPLFPPAGVKCQHCEVRAALVKSGVLK